MENSATIGSVVPTAGTEPVAPDYGGGSVCDIVPALLEPDPEPPSFLSPDVVDSPSVVVLVIDGLGWTQLSERARIAPTMAEMTGGPITSVAPTTTATALTSISTGVPPGEHGVIGYRIAIEGEVLNVLRWSTPRGDARKAIPPVSIQSHPAFLGHRPPVVSKAEFARSGFTLAHLAETRLAGYRTSSSIPVEVRRLVGAGEPFVYVYYDALDRIAHEYGLGEHYDAELASCDRLVADLLTALPRGASLFVTADHGQIDCTGGDIELGPAIRGLLEGESGEARFRWLHTRLGAQAEMLEAAREAHADQAWVRTRQEVIDAGWLGPKVTDAARERMGDVALVAREPVAFVDPADAGPIRLLGRHGSLTADEMLVPALSHVL